jgi:restriction system protein
VTDFSYRIPCTDGNCVGTINEKGYCSVCGKVPGIRSEIDELKTVKFPSLPTVSTHKIYESVFLPQALKTKLPSVVHLEDLSLFFSSIENAAHYRLKERISNCSVYPVDEPYIPAFPRSGIPGPRQLPLMPQKPKLKWSDYLLIWRILEKRILTFEQDLVKFEREKQKVELVNKWLSEIYDPQKKRFDEACHNAMEEWKGAKSQWEQKANQEKARLEELTLQYGTGNPKAVVEYFRTQLNFVPLPFWCPREYDLEFDEDEGILLIDVRLPYFRGLDVVKTRELKSGPVLVPANQREMHEFTNQFPFLIVLRLIWEVPQVDYRDRVGMVACNGYVIYDDPATGQRKRDIILTVAAKQEHLKNIKLERIDPEACFRSLRGVAAAKISELVPVQPLIRFNKEDSRFIAAREVLGTVGNTNLAAMDWQDFEHLIRELFQKEFGGGSAEVKITQTSRDRGVDAIAFDPDPLRGGKFVIQAKRYTNTVDVSAVRDLYGTVVNEGANRGILVTTSNYGIDAYDFAKDKPITLLNGENLLHLLQKHGYYMKIDIKEAKRLLKLE